MTRTPHISHRGCALPSPQQDDPPGAAPAAAPAPAQDTQNTAPGHIRGRDFGRLQLLSALKPDDGNSGRDKQKRRRRLLGKYLPLPAALRGDAHPAARDARYRRVFPWRDQRNQLHVHSELADPENRALVDPGLRLVSVTIDEGDEGQIRQDIAAGLFPGRRGGMPRLTEEERALAGQRYAALLAHLQAALEKTMRGEEPVPPEEVYVRRLEAADLAPGESALRGQYGLFNRRLPEGKWRTVSEGMHLCFFSGFVCRTEAEYGVECRRHSLREVAAYALSLHMADADFSCISPYGGGDLGQFANSALKRDGRGRLVEDGARINTRFACAQAVFEDRRPGGQGRLLSYPLAFLYMLAQGQAGRALERTEREARVCYGQAYWDGIEAMTQL